MSLLGDLFGYSLETQVTKEFAAFKNRINQMIERENAALRSLGIEPPRLISKVDCEMKRGTNDDGINHVNVKLVPPEFEFPPHLQFQIKSDALVCTLFRDLEDANDDYWLNGLEAVLDEHYGGIWTDRDPFALYRLLQRKPGKSITYKKPGELTEITQGKETWHLQYTFNIFAEKLSPVKVVPGLSPTEADAVHMRVLLCNYLFYDSSRPVNDSATFYPPYNVPDDILFYLPVAPIIGDSSCVKILPSGEIRPAQAVEFLNSLRVAVNGFISFELVRDGETVYFRLEFPTEYKNHIVSKLNLYFPEFEWLDAELNSPNVEYTVFPLQKNSAYGSIRRLRDFQLDPYAHFASFFEKVSNDDILSFKIRFAPITDEAAMTLKWHLERNQRYRNDVKSFDDKLPLWFACVDVASTNEQVSSEMIRQVTMTLDAPNQNFFAPESIQYSDRSFPNINMVSMSLYGTEELASLAHFPISELPIERLERVSMKNVQPPDLYKSGDVLIGESRARGQTFPVTLPESVRDRHVYVVGKSGTGKSTLIEAIARCDIEAGRGVAVIDPHGDLINHLLETMPEHRVADCVLFSPKHFPVSLEILTAENEHEIDLLSDDLITMFRRTSESWGDKMQAILQMAFQTLLRVQGSSFTDITRLLTDESYRRQILSKINHPQLASFWEQRYDVRQAEPILIRMDRLTTSGTLRAVLTQNKNSLNFYDVITESKIFLADLSKGYLGESTSHLLGSIIVSQIQLAAMRQAHLPAEQRIPFSLFVDEVQNFTTSAFSTILSEARKQKLRLTIAHQFVSQLPSDLQKAVFGNVGTLIFFALSPDDLGAARYELGTFEPSDVANLPKYHALCRPVTAARDTFSFATAAPPPPPMNNYKDAIIEQTRREYATPMATAGQQFSMPQASPVQPQSNPTVQPVASPTIDNRRPATASPLTFATNTEKILYFLRQAEYLTQPQIIALADLQPSNASTALKKLVETGQIKSLDDRRPKIYFIGRACNPTTHNLLVRDLFVKINASNFAVRSVKFNDNLSDLNPDLTVEFVTEGDPAPLLAYFELDRGTEGVQELVRKAERYARIENNPRVGFVFEREPDLVLARKTIYHPFVSYATLDAFTSLRDAAFYANDGALANDI